MSSEYHSIYPLTSMPEGLESELDSQPFDFLLVNPFARMNDLHGMVQSHYQRTEDIIGGNFKNNFNRLD